ncbi:MAG: porin [Magnetospirillum sp.]|nr:porin [Magnetospirillum sp.]
MKKVLIASTALVAASLVGTPASASEKIKLELGGFSKWWVVGAWNDSGYQNAQASSNSTAKASYNNVDVKGDNEIWFTGSTKLDNGLSVGIEVHLEAGGQTDMTSDTIDKSFVFVEGGFGKVLMGSNANGAVLLHVMAPDAAANIGSEGLLTGGLAIAQPAALSGIRTTTELDTDDNTEKLTYVTPAFHGLTLGASYIPNLGAEDSRGVQRNDTEVFGAGALYDNTYGDLGVKVSAGYITYDVNPADSTSNTTDRSHEWSVGTQLSYAGVTVGGAYRRLQTNFEAMGTSSSNTNGSNTSTSSIAGSIWDAGIQYAAGPYAVSFVYINSKAAGTRTVAGDDEMEVYQVSGKYALGPGVDVLGTIGHADFKDETTLASNNNKGWAVMTGLSLTF